MPVYWEGDKVTAVTGGEGTGSTGDYAKAYSDLYKQTGKVLTDQRQLQLGNTPTGQSISVYLGQGSLQNTSKNQAQISSAMGSNPSIQQQNQSWLEKLAQGIDNIVPGTALDTLPLAKGVTEFFKSPANAALGGAVAGASVALGGEYLYKQLTKKKKSRRKGAGKRSKSRNVIRSRRRSSRRSSRRSARRSARHGRVGSKAWMKYIRGMRGKKHHRRR